MRREIDFKGLSTNPSDHECVEGDLGAVVNLIPEDGALRPVTLEGRTVGTIPASCRIVAIHRGSGYAHWVLECVEDEQTVYKWMPVSGEGEPGEGSEFYLGDGFKANDVACIGNMICFVGDSETRYALWRSGVYQSFSMADLDYTVYITNDASERIGSGDYVEMSDDFIGCFQGKSDGFHPETDSEGIPTLLRELTVTKAGAARIWSALDAKLSETLAGETGEYLRHIVIGVAAVKLYDSSLVNVSDFFVLCPRMVNTAVLVERDGRRVRGQTYAHGHRLRVSMPYKSLLGDLVSGVSIFLTRGDMYLDLQKAYPVDLTTGTSSDFAGTFHYDRLSDDELYKAVDGESFFLMETIGMDKIGSSGGSHYIPSTEVRMHAVTGAEEAMTLADLRRGDIGGGVCYAYNNRLHIGGACERVGTPMQPRIMQDWPESRGSIDMGEIFGEVVDGPPYTGLLKMDMAVQVQCMSGGQGVTLRYALESLSYPFGPIFEIPYANASEADVLIRLCETDEYVVRHTYWRKHVTLHQSDSWGCSYYIDFGTDGWRLSQVRAYIGTIPYPRDDWEAVTEQVWREAFESASPAVLPGNPSLLKVSEVENPLVWPSGGALSVGNGRIMALSPNTESVSGGPFGEYLYVFTDEAVWLLNVDISSGLYSSSYEMSRDVLTDAASVTPMDKGVLFATSRGLMAAYGKSTKCLSDSLRGVPWQLLSVPHGGEVAEKRSPNLSVSEGEEVAYVTFAEYLSGARILYNYSRDRVFVFNPAYEYAYVLSLRSGLWGAVECRLKDTVPSYLSALAIVDNEADHVREVVEIGGEAEGRIGVLCCTRPLAFDSPHVHKSVLSAVVRGLFHGRGSGEKSRIGCIMWGSNDLFHWHAVMSSDNQYLRGRIGTPYQWWRICVVGGLEGHETLDGVSFEVQERLRNRIR